MSVALRMGFLRCSLALSEIRRVQPGIMGRAPFKGGGGLGGGGVQPPPNTPASGAEVLEALKAPNDIVDWPKARKKIGPNL